MAGLQSISGLSSGLDTATIVSQLMQIEQQPLVRLQQRERVEQARQTALSLVQTKLDALSDALDALKSTSTWADAQTVESSDPTRVAAARTAGAAAGGYQVWVRTLARADQVTQQNAAFAAAADADTLSITVAATSATPAQTVNVAIGAGDDLATIASKINGSSGSPVYATVVAGKLVLSGKTTGADAQITVADGDTGNAYDLATDVFGSAPLSHTSADAEVSLDGTSWTTRPTNTVDDLLPGVKLTLKATSVDPVSIVVGTPGADADAITAAVQAFVDAYDDAVTTIRGKLDEKPVANPQSDADRAKGVLYGDSGLSGLLSSLRAAMSRQISGLTTLKTALDAGVSTGAAVGSGTLDQDAIAGKLKLDTATLSSALDASFADVKTIFTGADGVVTRLRALLDPWTVGTGSYGAILDSRLQVSRDTVTAYQRDEATMQLQLTARQTRLEAQFTAMETALSSAQSQAQWLAGQLARLG